MATEDINYILVLSFFSTNLFGVIIGIGKVFQQNLVDYTMTNNRSEVKQKYTILHVNISFKF